MDETVSMLEQVLGLLDALLNAVVLDSLVIVLNNFEMLNDLPWHDSLCELAHTLEAVVTEDWHDTWNYRAVDTSLTAVFHPFVKDFVVVKELSDDEIGSRIDFCF